MIHYYRYLFLKMKVFNYPEFHFSEVTSFKIHTLKKFPIDFLGQLTSSTTEVDMKLSLTSKSNQAMINITGPDGKWFGVGLGAKTLTMVGFFYETVFYDFSKFQHPASEAANKFEVFQIRQSIAHFDHWKPLISRM